MVVIYQNLAQPKTVAKKAVKKTSSVPKYEKLQKEFKEHMSSENWHELLTPADVVLFFREAFYHFNGKQAARTSYTRWLKVAKNLLADYGAKETLQIIACSFMDDNPPIDMGWYQSGFLTRMLLPDRYEFLKTKAGPSVMALKKKLMEVAKG